MKILYRVLILTLLQWFALSLSAQDILREIENAKTQKGCAHSKIHQHNTFKNVVKSTGWNAYDLLYHRIQWNIDPNIKYISGSVFSV